MLNENQKYFQMKFPSPFDAESFERNCYKRSEHTNHDIDSGENIKHLWSVLSLIDLTLAWHNLAVGISFSCDLLEYIAIVCMHVHAEPFGQFQIITIIIIIAHTHPLNNLQAKRRRRLFVCETQCAQNK